MIIQEDKIRQDETIIYVCDDIDTKYAPEAFFVDCVVKRKGYGLEEWTTLVNKSDPRKERKYRSSKGNHNEKEKQS